MLGRVERELAIIVVLLAVILSTIRMSDQLMDPRFGTGNIVPMIPSSNASRKLAIELQDGRMPAAADDRLILVFAALFGLLLLVLIMIPAVILIVIWIWEASTPEMIVGLLLLALFTVGYFSLIYFAESRGLTFRSR